MNLNRSLKLYFLLGLIICGIAGGVVGLFFEKISSHLDPDDVMSAILFGGSILLSALILKDVRDKKVRYAIRAKKRKFQDLIRSEFRSLWQELCCYTTKSGLLAYFLWATSQYIVLILFTDFQIKYTPIVVIMMCGYLLGVAVLGFCKRMQDEKIIRLGFAVTVLSFLSFFVVDFFVDDNTNITAISCFFYTMGNAFLSPSILSLFSKERTAHNQGQGFGLIVSADSSGFLVASVIVIVLNYFDAKLEYVILISFLTFLISWFPYIEYEKRRANAARNSDIKA
jgi:hypothetical protein